MPFSDLVSVSSLKLTDVAEAASVLLASMSRDPYFQCKLPHSQRDFDTTWNARVQKISAGLTSILKHSYTIILVAKYVPDNRIIGTISTYHIKATEMRWSKPDTEALLQDYTFYCSHLTKEVSMPFLNQYTVGYERAFKDCDITGRFWHMDGICTLTGFEGKGIGSKLIEALFSRLSRIPEAPRKVFVMSNSNSRRIYEDYGFKLSSTVKIDVNKLSFRHMTPDIGQTRRPPKYFTEYYLTYDLSNTVARTQPSNLARIDSLMIRPAINMNQFSRILRPVQSMSDLPSRNSRVERRKKAKQVGGSTCVLGG